MDRGPGALVEGSDRAMFDAAVEAGRELDTEELLAAAAALGPDPRFATLDDEAVVLALGTAASTVAAATARYLSLLAELVVRGVWADQGARTPAVWLSWKLGVAPSTAREHLRVALRLRTLPRVAERLAEGTLSYSKVRAITRIGRSTDEALLLSWADHGTAADLDRIASATRSTRRRAEVDPFDDDAPTAHRWHLRTHHDGTATLTVTGPVEDLLRLEDEVHRLAEHDLRDRGPGRADDGGGDDAAADGGGDEAANDAAGDAANAAAIDAEDGREAPRVTAGERFAALCGVVAAAAAGGTPPDTSGLDGHTLVLQMQAADLAGGDAPGDPAAIVAVTDAHHRVGAMHRSVLRRLACDAGVVAAVRDGVEVLDLGRRTRRPSAALRRAVHLRDRGRCAFPGCDATRHLHVHHVEHWADGGPTALDNLVLLCGHHHRYVHATTAVIEVRPDGRHLVRAARDAEVLAHSPRLVGVAGDAPVLAGTARATAVPDASGPGASAEALGPVGRASAEALEPPGYDGVGFDLELAVAVLQARQSFATDTEAA